MVLKYFTSSFAVTAAGLIAGGMIGGWSAVFTTAILAILETSLSFDNAVVNATVLKDMDIKWRKRFITWGMLIAVFGMRMVFPLVIVAVIAGVGIIDAFRLAVFNPVKKAVRFGSRRESWWCSAKRTRATKAVRLSSFGKSHVRFLFRLMPVRLTS